MIRVRIDKLFPDSEPVVTLKFDYDQLLINIIKDKLSELRLTTRIRNVGGWYPAKKVWFVEKVVWDKMREHLLQQGYEVDHPHSQHDSHWRESIDATPSDMDLRLVFSDWLEEQGDLKEAFVQRKIVEGGWKPYTHQFVSKSNERHWINSTCYGEPFLATIWFRKRTSDFLNCGWVVSCNPVGEHLLPEDLFFRMGEGNIHSHYGIYIWSKQQVTYGKVAIGFKEEKYAWKSLEEGVRLWLK